jgi:FKBP-type peptidyl-prolyl cis-trans isomerase FklB
MKKILILLVLISTGLTCFAQRNKRKSPPPPPPPVFALLTAEDSLAYALGVLNYQSLNNELIKKYNLDVKLETLTRGMTDFSKDTSLINPSEANAFLGNYMMKKESQLSKVEEAAGKKFLAENVSRPGITVTPSGLQYEVISMGTGNKPLPTDRVKVHYNGTLVDGTVFDSSVERGEPAVFTLNQVIPGWTEGLQLMPTGSKFRFYIPSELGYGARSAGALIKPNSVLIFDVELISIEP